MVLFGNAKSALYLKRNLLFDKSRRLQKKLLKFNFYENENSKCDDNKINGCLKKHSPLEVNYFLAPIISGGCELV